MGIWRVNVEGEGGAPVADLAHHLSRVGTEGDQDRGKGVAQLVGGEPLRQRQLATLAKQLVGALEDLRQDALPQVAAVAPAAGPGRKARASGPPAGGRALWAARMSWRIGRVRISRRPAAVFERPTKIRVLARVDVAFEHVADRHEGESLPAPGLNPS